MDMWHRKRTWFRKKKKKRRFVRWKRRSVLFLFQIFTELIGFFKGFGVSRRFAGAVQTAYEQ